ncbi:hypothetical protein J1N35_000838 [Gossypium stocksii]|uniref:RNase H type-1 domain-containing protein n=1 Tax=Gossypium stocksii TaxID=47602 RepID=A0A9D3WHY9_9ROSI|nr:hypothetical protein J1N35_000838 [Gossypium stocksii]
MGTKEDTRKRLDPREFTSELGAGQAQMRVDQDAERGNANASGNRNRSPMVEHAANDGANKGTLADKRETSTSQQLSNLVGIEGEEVVEVGSLDAGKHSAVTFTGDKNGLNASISLNKSLHWFRFRWLGNYTKTIPNSAPNSTLNDSYVFLSTDGAVAPNSGHAATGGVVRDRDGNWIMGFTHFLGVYTPFEVEVWSILDGILILLNKGYRRAIILTNNLEVSPILTDSNMVDFGITVLKRTQWIMKAEGIWRIKHIPRSQNLVADCLAKLSLS